MYSIKDHLPRLYLSKRFYSDEATKFKKTIFLPITKFKNRLNVDQNIQRDNYIFKVIQK